RAESARHRRQRDVGDRRVEYLHDRGEHDRDGDQPAMRHVVRVDRPGFEHGFVFREARARSGKPPACRSYSAAFAMPNRLAKLCETSVSTSTLALMPVRMSTSSPPVSSFSLTGMRCVTFTQLPVAFCAGSSENSAPVPAPMLSTVAWKGTSG